jgi:hypothetical protein
LAVLPVHRLLANCTAVQLISLNSAAAGFIAALSFDIAL